MSEEEKQAIDELKKLKDYKKTYYGGNWSKVEVCMDNEIKQTIDTILKLIEKQQKEIEELKEITKMYDSVCINTNNKVVIADKEYFDSGIFIKKYVSKNKIREKQNKYKKKIEKLENKKIWNEPVDTINNNRYVNYFNAYEELLDDEN